MLAGLYNKMTPAVCHRPDRHCYTPVPARMYKPREPSFSYVLLHCCFSYVLLHCCGKSGTSGFIELPWISSKLTNHILTGNKEIAPNNNWTHEKCRETFVSSCSNFFGHLLTFRNILRPQYTGVPSDPDTADSVSVCTAGVTNTEVFYSCCVRVACLLSVTVLCKQIFFYINTVIPRLTKIIRSGITFVSRNLR